MKKEIKSKCNKRAQIQKDLEKKEEQFVEIQSIEEARIGQAQHALFDRLDDDSKAEAYRWSHMYNQLLGGNDETK
ncbi:hypothetical protein OAJ67_01520 [Candidatus Nitrosopelagicus sp.]|nr:hypothetical protein [Candidatus Nitrosopelagicus sp.]